MEHMSSSAVALLVKLLIFQNLDIKTESVKGVSNKIFVV